jgi:hypothetical protein
MELRELLALGEPCWLAGIKYAVACIGIGSGRLVLPIYTMMDAE